MPAHLRLVPPPEASRHEQAVARAVALMKTALAERWTVAQLARRVGVSRPVLAKAFTETRGVSPIRTLTELRLARAQELLVGSDRKLAAIAVEVGYVSEYAFNRAFRRHFGVPPGTFRRFERAGTFRAAA